MNPHQGREFARPQEPVMPGILRGDAWTARRIRNYCLRQHCHALATTFRWRDYTSLKAVCARIFLVLETRSRVLTHIHPTELAVVAGVARLGAYADLWLREPEDWWPDARADARTQWAELLRHLLARYPVPAFLDFAWEIPGALEHLERDCWCALAGGRSLRGVHGFPQSVPHRVLHAALTDLSEQQRRTLVQAIWAAQLRAFDASPGLQSSVLSSQVLNEFGNYAFWSRLAAKFSANSDAQASQFGFVTEVLIAVRAHRGTRQVEQLLKVPLENLLRYCVRFATDLLNANGHLLTEAQVAEAAAKSLLSRLANSRWQPFLGPVSFASKRGKAGEHPAWRVEELCSVDALRDEGRALRHCVAVFAQRCRNGCSAIFSVRHYKSDFDGNAQATSCATIEVHPPTRKVVQIRAWRDRPVNNTIMTIVTEWAEANDLLYMR